MSSSMTISIETEEPMSSPPFTCSLCCEEKPGSDSCVLSSCGHQSCNTCMIKWIEKEESSGQATVNCPFCRVNIAIAELATIIGRPFQPRGGTGSNPTTNNEAEIDELTLHWLNEQTVQCQSCGARIEKVPGGCDMMECLCGYRFCYRCGSQNSQCSCTPAHHYFWDNVLDRTGGNRQSPRSEASRDEETGRIDLRSHIQDKDHADKIRKERQLRRRRFETEEMDASKATTNGRWLFACNSVAGSKRMLDQQVNSDRKRRERSVRSRRYQIEANDSQVSTGWLFLPDRSRSMRVLSEQLKGGDVDRRRRNRQILSEKENSRHVDLSAVWMFLPEKAASRFLANEAKAFRIRQYRAKTQNFNIRLKREAKITDVDQFVMGGSWLFAKKTKEKTYQYLTRMLRHVCRADNANMDYTLASLFYDGCGRPDCPNCGGRSRRFQNEEDGEDANLKNIIWLFSNDDDA